MATKKKTAKGSAKATIDHDEIREWVEQRGGTPATVKRTRRGGSPGILRIDFPGYSGEESLEAISWDEFFEQFEESNLAFLMQDKTVGGRPSRFSKLVSRDGVEVDASGSNEEGSEEPRRSAKKRATRKTAEKKRTSRTPKGGDRAAEAASTRKKTSKPAAPRRNTAPRGARGSRTTGADPAKKSLQRPVRGGGRTRAVGTTRTKSAARAATKRTTTKRRAT